MPGLKSRAGLAAAAMAANVVRGRGQRTSNRAPCPGLRCRRECRPRRRPSQACPQCPSRPPCRARTRRPSLSPRTVDPRSDHRAAPGPDARADRRAAAAPVPDARAGHRAAPVPDARTDLALDTVGEPTYVPTSVPSFGPYGPSGWPSCVCAGAAALHRLQPSPAHTSPRRV